jgi:hypothetical protein
LRTRRQRVTFYIWKKKYSNLALNELRELHQLREENLKLKRLVADLSLDRHILQEIIQKNALRPCRRHELARWTQTAFALSLRRVAGLLRLDYVLSQSERSATCAAGALAGIGRE